MAPKVIFIYNFIIYNMSNKKKHEIYLGGKNGQTKVKSVTMSIDSLRMYVGDEYQLSFKIYPVYSVYSSVKWVSSNDSIVTVDDNGHIKALKEGTVVIKVIVNNRQASCKIQVIDIIRFADDNVKQILVKYYDKDNDGEISYAEARRVQEIPFPMFANSNIRTFNELAYFTNVKKIGIHAFDSCNDLTEITFPDSLKIVERNAFAYCTSIESITLPSSVSNIGNNAFSHCDNLTTAYVNSPIPPNAGTTIFDICKSLEDIIVPEPSIDMYLETIGWGIDDSNMPLYYSYISRQGFDYTFDFYLS